LDFEPGGFWSHTLGRDLAACERRVYYRIWGAFGGWSAEGPPLARLLYTARCSKDLRSYAGTVVHSAIRRLIERVRVGLRVPPLQLWLDRFDERIRAEVAYSASRRWLRLANPKKATVILHEHLVGEDLHDWQVDEAIDIAIRSFQSFWTNYLPQIQEVGPERIVLVDSLDKFEFDCFDLFLSPDLVLVEEFEDEIIDWKTGTGTNAEQLEAYGLYWDHYRRKKGLAERPMIGRSVPLLAPEKELRIQIDAAAIGRAEARIRADIATLRTFELRVGDGDLAFPKASEASACEWCSFAFHCDLRPGGPTTGAASAVGTVPDAGGFVPTEVPDDGWYLVVLPGPAGPVTKVLKVDSRPAEPSVGRTMPAVLIEAGHFMWRRLGGPDWMLEAPKMFPLNP